MFSTDLESSPSEGKMLNATLEPRVDGVLRLAEVRRKDDLVLEPWTSSWSVSQYALQQVESLVVLLQWEQRASARVSMSGRGWYRSSSR